MDPFAVIMLGGVAGLVLALYLLGRVHPGSGADVLGLKPRSAEEQMQNEIDDLDQMLEAANERRRARGRPELTEEGLQAELASENAAASRKREDHLRDLDIAQMVERKNERRRARGLPELTVEQERARLERELGL